MSSIVPTLKKLVWETSVDPRKIMSSTASIQKGFDKMKIFSFLALTAVGGLTNTALLFSNRHTFLPIAMQMQEEEYKKYAAYNPLMHLDDFFAKMILVLGPPILSSLSAPVAMSAKLTQELSMWHNKCKVKDITFKTKVFETIEALWSVSLTGVHAAAYFSQKDYAESFTFLKIAQVVWSGIRFAFSPIKPLEKIYKQVACSMVFSADEVNQKVKYIYSLRINCPDQDFSLFEELQQSKKEALESYYAFHNFVTNTTQLMVIVTCFFLQDLASHFNKPKIASWMRKMLISV